MQKELPKALNKTIISLHISAVLYAIFAVLFGVIFSLVAREDPVYFIFAILISGISVGMVVLIEIVISSLKKEKKWAYNTALAICLVYIPSAYILLGVFGLLGLIDNEVKKIYIKK